MIPPWSYVAEDNSALGFVFAPTNAAALLKVLMEYAGEVAERDELYRAVWDTEYVEDIRSLHVHIKLLWEVAGGDFMSAAIMIVDDDKESREFLERALSEKGCHVHNAETGQEALGVLEEKEIDLLILELKLLDRSGVEVMRQVDLRYP